MARSQETPHTVATETDDVQQSLELLDRVLLEFEDPNSGPSSRIHDPAEDTAPSEEPNGGPSTAEPPPPEEAARLISALMPRGSPRSSPGQSLRRSPHNPGEAVSPSQVTAATQTTLPKATRHHGYKKLSSRFGSLPFDLSSHAAPQNPPAWLQVLEKRAQRDCAAGTSSNGACAVGDRNHLHLPLQNPLTTSLNQEANSASSCSDVEDEEQFSDDSLDCQVSSSDREADLRDMESATSQENIADAENGEGQVEGRQRGSIAWDIPLDWDLDLAACEESASKKRRKDNPPGVSRSQPQTPSCPPPVLPTPVSGSGTYVIRERKKRPALDDAFSYCPVIPTSATYTCGLSHVSQYKPPHKTRAAMSKGKSLPSLLPHQTPSCLTVPDVASQQLPCNSSRERKSKPESDDPVLDMNEKENAINNTKVSNVQEMSFKIMRPKKIRPHSMPPSEGDIVVFKSTVQLESSHVNDKHDKMRPISMPFNGSKEGEMCSVAIVPDDAAVNGSDLCNTGNNASSAQDTCCNKPRPESLCVARCSPADCKSMSCSDVLALSENRLEATSSDTSQIKARPQSVCVSTCPPVDTKPRPTSCSVMLVSETLSETKSEVTNSESESRQSKGRPQSVCVSTCSPVDTKPRPMSCAFIPLNDLSLCPSTSPAGPAEAQQSVVSPTGPAEAQHSPRLRPKSMCVIASAPFAGKQRPTSCHHMGKFDCDLNVEQKIDILLAQSLDCLVPQVSTMLVNGQTEDKTFVAQNNNTMIENKPVVKHVDQKEIILLQNTLQLCNGIDTKSDAVFEEQLAHREIEGKDKVEIKQLAHREIKGTDKVEIKGTDKVEIKQLAEKKNRMVDTKIDEQHTRGEGKDKVDVAVKQRTEENNRNVDAKTVENHARDENKTKDLMDAKNEKQHARGENETKGSADAIEQHTKVESKVQVKAKIVEQPEKDKSKTEVSAEVVQAINSEVIRDDALLNGDSTEAVQSTDVPPVTPPLPYTQDEVPSALPDPPNDEELEDKFGTVSSLVQTDISAISGKRHRLCLDSPGEEQVVPSLSYRTNVLLTPDDPPHPLSILQDIPLIDKVTVQCGSQLERKFECLMDDDDSLTITTVIIESKDDEKKDDFVPIKRPADLFTSKLESKLSRDSTRRKSHGSTLEMTSKAQENRRSAPECSFLFPQGHYTIPLSFAVTNKPPGRNQEIQDRPPVPLPETPTPKPLGPLEPTYKSVRKEKKPNGVAKRGPQPPPLPPHQNLSPPEDEYAEPRKIPDFPSTARKPKPVRPRNLVTENKAPPPPPHQGDMFEAEKPLPPTPLTPVQNNKLSILEDFDCHPLPPSPHSPKPPRPLPTSATFPVPPSPAAMHRGSPHGGRRRHTPPSPLLPRPPSPRSRPHPLPPSPCDEIDGGWPRRPLPSPPESDYGFTREAGGPGLGSLKTRSVDAGLGRGLREQLQNSISQAREVGSDRRTLPTELSGATPRRHAGPQYNTSARTGKKKGRAPTVPPHASLPETPVFTRGCDIPRAPYRPPAVGIPVLRSSLSEEGDRLVLCGPARGWYPKQRQNKSARSTENLDQASSVWGEPRKPQTLPPNLNPPKFFHRSPREALRRVTSLLIRRAGNSTSKEPRTSKDVVSPNGASGSQCETPQRQKRSFFRNFWKKSKHYSLEQ